MLDKQFTEKLQQWLDTPAGQRDYVAGAELLLRLNRNKMMYRRFLLRENMPRLEHHLRKFLRIRLEGLTLQEVAVKERETMESVARTIKMVEDNSPAVSADGETPAPVFSGLREDHDLLPEEIKALPERNAEIFAKLKQCYMTLQGMRDQQPCDRYEYCNALLELDTALNENWELYDHYRIGDALPAGEEGKRELTEEEQRTVSAARKFLSTKKKKMQGELSEEEKASVLLEMQERVDVLLSLEQTFKDETREELRKFGISFGSE